MLLQLAETSLSHVPMDAMGFAMRSRRWLLAMAGLLVPLAAGCQAPRTQVDPDHAREVDAMVSSSTTSRINALALLAADPRVVPEPPAGTLTRQDAINHTLTHNLALIASAENLPIAQAQLAQAGLWTNPSLGQTGSFAWPVFGGSGAASFDFQLTQVVNTFLTRPYKVAVAEAQRFQSGIDLASQAFDLSQQAEAKYDEMAHLVRDRKLSEKVAASYKRAFEAAEARAKVGMVPTPDVNRARLQYEDAQRQVRHLQTQYSRAAREMNWLMGVSSPPLWQLPEEAAEAPRDLALAPDAAMLEQMGRGHRLDLRRADFDRRVSEANLKLAKLGMIPQLTLGTDVARDNSKNWSFGPSFNVELPIFDTGKVGVELANAQLRLADKTYVALEGQVRQDVRAAVENLLIADEDVRFYRDKLIPQEEENVQLAQKSFQLGNSDLDSLLNTLREYVSALQSYEDAIDTYNGNRIALQRAVGMVWARIIEASNA
ncbi:MAG: TolC family protein, partial [Tepidisphaeraceae bacterium]